MIMRILTLLWSSAFCPKENPNELDPMGMKLVLVAFQTFPGVV